MKHRTRLEFCGGGGPHEFRGCLDGQNCVCHAIVIGAYHAIVIVGGVIRVQKGSLGRVELHHVPWDGCIECKVGRQDRFDRAVESVHMLPGGLQRDDGHPTFPPDPLHLPKLIQIVAEGSPQMPDLARNHLHIVLIMMIRRIMKTIRLMSKQGGHIRRECRMCLPRFFYYMLAHTRVCVYRYILMVAVASHSTSTSLLTSWAPKIQDGKFIGCR